MCARSQVSLALLGLCLLSVLAHPQKEASTQQSTPTPAGSTTLASPANDPSSSTPLSDHRIELDVVVTDKAGNPQPGLQQQDFTVLDDKQPESILSFHASVESSATDPVQVIFLLDAINTGVRTMGFERQELEKFLRQDQGHLALLTSLVFLTDTSTEISPSPTRDGNGLADLLRSKQTGPRIIGSSQGIDGAIDRFKLSVAAVEKLANYEQRQPGRKLLIWFSPGWPLLSGPRIQFTEKNENWLFTKIAALSRSLREARVTLYNVDPLGMSGATASRAVYYRSFLEGVPSPDKAMAADLALQVLATQSGGKVLNSNNDLTNLIASCLIDSKAYYTLSFVYPPADHLDEYHSLEVKVDKPGVIARTRTGYYAQPYKGAGR